MDKLFVVIKREFMERVSQQVVRDHHAPHAGAHGRDDHSSRLAGDPQLGIE